MYGNHHMEKYMAEFSESMDILLGKMGNVMKCWKKWMKIEDSLHFPAVASVGRPWYEFQNMFHVAHAATLTLRTSALEWKKCWFQATSGSFLGSFLECGTWIRVNPDFHFHSRYFLHCERTPRKLNDELGLIRIHERSAWPLFNVSFFQNYSNMSDFSEFLHVKLHHFGGQNQ